MHKMILLVEDNEDNRDMLTRRLTREGFIVRCAVDGPAGVEMASKERPDLILMDVALGEMDGWEATQLIKAAPDTATIPIIALTAHALTISSRQKCGSRLRGFRHQARRLPRLLGKIKACLEALRPSQLVETRKANRCGGSNTPSIVVLSARC
jgi:CheY-like chemotaxis protein